MKKRRSIDSSVDYVVTAVGICVCVRDTQRERERNRKREAKTDARRQDGVDTVVAAATNARVGGRLFIFYGLPAFHPIGRQYHARH